MKIIAFILIYISPQRPFPLTLIHNLHRPLLVQRDPARVQDGRGGDRVLERGEPPGVELLERHAALVECGHGVDELLEADVPVAGLAAEVAFFVGGVAHVEAVDGVVSYVLAWLEGRAERNGDLRVQPDELALVVVCQVVASFRLVDADFTFGAHP